MKIISFITKSQSDVIRRILEHLGIWEEIIRPPPSNGQPFLRTITYAAFDDGWPGGKDPYITADSTSPQLTDGGNRTSTPFYSRISVNSAFCHTPVFF
jgi:hypothetical protein